MPFVNAISANPSTVRHVTPAMSSVRMLWWCVLWLAKMAARLHVSKRSALCPALCRTHIMNAINAPYGICNSVTRNVSYPNP
jgi:hypothetical protein